MRRSTLALTALLALAAAPASADWLVTHAGTRVETRGAWQVKGKLVVFHTPDGALSSLRLSEVDLDASGHVTAEAERARQTAAAVAARGPEKKAPVLVLTDDKVRHVETGAPAPGAGVPAAATTPRLTVSNWDRTPESAGGNVVLIGTLQNGSPFPVTDIGLTVQLVDAEGQATATAQAVLTSTSLGPNQQSGFRVAFPDVTTYSDVKFDPRGAGPPPPPPKPEPPPAEKKENP